MNIWESLKIALSSIWNHKVRSILTMLGIIIGVAAVIIIVAIGQGTKKQMTNEMFGTEKNAIQIYYEYIPPEGEVPTGWIEPELTNEDVQTLSEVPGVKAVMATNQGWGMMLRNDVQGEMQITGVGAEYFSAKTIEVLEGRAFYAADNDGLNRVVMIDTIARKKFFKENENPIGEIIDLNGNPYKIVGVYVSPIPEQFRNKDTGEMMMPRAVISMMFGNREIEQLSVIASDPEQVSETGRLAAETLTEKKGLEEGSRYVTNNFEDYEKELNKMISLLTLLIGSIAGISLLVGGIGVMNIMLVSVTERTREIGLRKAIGATRRKILLQFLIEAITLTSLGGLVGMGLAAIGTILVSKFSPITASMSPLIVLIGISFSAFIGIIFGLLPANKASKLSPIDALRYE